MRILIWSTYGITQILRRSEVQVSVIKWTAAGILLVGDLINNHGSYHTYREIISGYNLRTHFLDYNGQIGSVHVMKVKVVDQSIK